MDNVKLYGEVFTPSSVIEKLIELADIDFSKDVKIYEPSFGDGRIINFIIEKFKKYHSITDILSMVYGTEIQKTYYDEFVSQFNTDHNFHNINALQTESFDYPLMDMFGSFDYIIGNPPYNNNMLKKKDVDISIWQPAGYVTKLAYICFMVLANYMLKPNGKMVFITPISFMMNDNTILSRKWIKKHFNIEYIEILSPDTFESVMIRTAIIIFTKKPQQNDIVFIRHWNSNTYKSVTNYYNNRIPLFLGDESKNIFDALQNKKKLDVKVYKGWMGVDSYKYMVSSDVNKYQYKYVDKIKRNGEIVFKSSKVSDKTKAKVNSKKNNIGEYNRFGYPKIIINEICFNSLEVNKHTKNVLIDHKGEYAASNNFLIINFPKNTSLERLEGVAKWLVTPLIRMYFSILKDYNHNSSYLFDFIPDIFEIDDEMNKAVNDLMGDIDQSITQL